MASINVFVIVGNLVKDPELRYTPSGTPTTTYAVAVDEVWTDREGNRQKRCDYIPVTTYGRQAESDVQFLKKGSGVAVTGCMRSWFNKELQKGGFNFEADHVKYLGKPTANGERNDREGPAAGGHSEHDDWLGDYDRTEQAGKAPDR